MRGGWAPAWAIGAVLLAGCGAAGDWSKADWSKADWTKAGADAAAAAGEYQECRAMAATAVKSQADIDQDILASRQNDWQRASIVRVQTRTTQDATRDRAAAIVDACMRAKGFSRPG